MIDEDLRAIIAAMCFVAGLVLAAAPVASIVAKLVAVALIFAALLILPMPLEGWDDDEDS